jgi:tetratricopeptide (TPR) repeat protein
MATRFKYIFFQNAKQVLIFGLLLGALPCCSQIIYSSSSKDQQQYAQIERYYRQGAYQQSLEYCDALITGYPGSRFYDQALLYAGLNSVQLHFPDDDYRSALRYFQQVIEKSPNSPLADQSAAWVAVLSRLQRAQQDELNTEDQLRRCRQTQDEKDRAIVKLKTETEKLKKEIELLKKVDLQIHQQKKDMTNAGKQ